MQFGAVSYRGASWDNLPRDNRTLFHEILSYGILSYGTLSCGTLSCGTLSYGILFHGITCWGNPSVAVYLPRNVGECLTRHMLALTMLNRLPLVESEID